MPTEQEIDRALQHLADTFLEELRPVKETDGQSGWGQFIGQQDGEQVGLYGTCSGVICVALAYGAQRIPDTVINYLSQLWDNRLKPGTAGARNFALTARLAFFVMTLRIASDDRFKRIISDADRELRDRILPDALFVVWQISPTIRSAIGDDVTTALVVLTFGLTGSVNTLPPEIQRSADRLRSRIQGSPTTQPGIKKFIFAALAVATSPSSLPRSTSRMIANDQIAPGQDAMNYWDYKYADGNGIISRRDWLQVTSEAIDMLLASATLRIKKPHDASIQLLDEVTNSIQQAGLYFGGRETATSKTQAWIAIALHRSKCALYSSTTENKKRFSLRTLLFWRSEKSAQ